MKLLVVSDNHGRSENIIRAINKVGQVDAFFHLGDLCMDQEQIEKYFTCPTFFVAGNNDWTSEMDNERIVRVINKKILMVHGHYQGVYFGLDKLATYAGYKGVDVVMFGHTHQPCIEQRGKITLINPGSIERPRQFNHKPSYITIDVDANGEFHYKINYL